MKLSLFSLNLKGFTDRDMRFSKIIEIIKTKNPDIIVFQEARYNPKQYTNNAVELLNEHLQYPHISYAPYFNYSQDYGKGILSHDDIWEGLGIISKLPFSSQIIDLPIQQGIDRRPRIALECNFGDFSLSNIHLSKHSDSRSSEWTVLPQSDIIVGDFNMQNDEVCLFKGNYISSYDFKAYISYPSKEITLDYCLIKDGVFKGLETYDQETYDQEISDHVGLYVEIEI